MDPSKSTSNSQANTLPSTYDPTNIDSPGFDPETYVTKLLRESRLTQLVDKEQLLTKQIKTLDNEMQTLVYENYNKFISATDTIRQMKKDFKTMEDEMTRLISTMSTINSNNHQIHLTLDNRRQEIRKLTSIHVLLQKLQYLFQLPAKLKEYADDNQYDLAVNTYTKALKALQKYEHIPSFNHIQQTCKETMTNIRDELKSRIDQQQTSSNVVKLLLQLGESSDYLAQQYLSQNKLRLEQPLELMKQQLIVVESQLGSSSSSVTTSNVVAQQMHPMDILEFVDTSYNSYIKNLHEFVESYELLFIRNSSNIPSSPSIEDEYKERCKHYLEMFLLELYSAYIKLIHDLFQSKYYGQDDDIQLYVRAIDRFLRRSSNDIYKYLFTQHALEKMRSMLDAFLKFAIECRLKFYHSRIDRHFHDQVIELRKSLTIIQTNEQIQSSPDHQQSQLNLSQCVDKMLKQLTNDIKSTFQNLSKFLDGTELVCYTGKKNVFMKQFATNHVWNGFFLTLLERLITYFEHEYTTASNHSTMIRHEQSSPPILLLILSKLILDFDSSSTPYLCTVFEEKFNFILENNQRGDNQKSGSSSFSIDRSKLTAVQKQFSVIAKQLLKQYICSQGFTLSQMLRKSIETRDWLNTVEPRHVRSVMKRIVEDLTQIDKQVKTLYNDQQSPAPLSSSYGRYYHRSNLVSGGARSSDGGRRTIIMPRSSALDRTTSGGPGSSAGSTGNLQLNFHKVFNEKLDIFIDLQFQKTSILSSIIKLLLKTYLECIRLKTFSRYGLQQVQVDINYLYNYLWSFVNNDDRFITNLLEEIVSSTAMRCLDPVLMEASVITVICEGN
ncbi:unnamed protein product [Rotaria magnacalcarata]|uniref:Vacuolar protein sorting-associated protein 51 homolog n=4 Tax=Rotaria magnacalcarata TaxID=392030 RepID=A0A815K3Q8_9BILA|nr:unnamed protein product [Rotaria magnacalcarata]CAF1435489.1 unnamed protein product [Rotaria magnacalcarata]CAF2061540.1 unnamed protein product [Rotaria magnacalcarata]